jgi:hypothetical protein
MLYISIKYDEKFKINNIIDIAVYYLLFYMLFNENIKLLI